MCLRTKMRIAKKADRPIYCYKLLHFDKERNLFTSPVTKAVYRRDERMYAGGFSIVLPEPREGVWANVTYGFHSYMGPRYISIYGMTINMEDPETLNILYGISGVVVAKCVIPYGARYWEGNSMGVGSDEYDQYCSDRIELVAYLDPDTCEWKRPGRAYDEQVKPAVDILRGLTIAEAKERLGYWYVCESCQLNYNSGVYRFNRVGTYGSVELRTWCNRVTSVN